MYIVFKSSNHVHLNWKAAFPCPKSPSPFGSYSKEAASFKSLRCWFRLVTSIFLDHMLDLLFLGFSIGDDVYGRWPLRSSTTFSFSFTLHLLSSMVISWHLVNTIFSIYFYCTSVSTQGELLNAAWLLPSSLGPALPHPLSCLYF